MPKPKKQSKRRDPNDPRQEIRAVWVLPEFVDRIDRLRLKRRWSRAQYVLNALEQYVQADEMGRVQSSNGSLAA